jgi:hypothetical protein
VALPTGVVQNRLGSEVARPLETAFGEGMSEDHYFPQLDAGRSEHMS